MQASCGKAGFHRWERLREGEKDRKRMAAYHLSLLLFTYEVRHFFCWKGYTEERRARNVSLLFCGTLPQKDWGVRALHLFLGDIPLPRRE